MSKVLEAFEELKTVMNKLFSGVERCENSLRIVKQALKDKEKKDKAFNAIVKTLDIRVSMNESGQCFLEDNHCIYTIPRSIHDLLKEVGL